MEFVMESSQWARTLLSGGVPSAGSEFCLGRNVTYEHRVDNPEGWNWCLVPDGGFDAVFFAGVAIAVMCLASPRWDALIVLFFGGIYFTFAYYWNLEHVSNAVMLWLGMRPSDIFVFVFLPPFLLDLSVRIDFFVLKKVGFNVAFMAFVMVAASALILIPFMLYALDLKSSGWTAGHVALFGSMIASTDAASVSAVLRSGGGPEILSVLLEGESLFNDASSLTLFEIFKEVVLEDERTTLAHDLRGIVVMTVWSAFTGICIGLAMGIFTRWVFAWLQHRNMEAMAEVAWSIAGAYLSFYITQVWCKGSGCIGSVVFGLYGSSTLLWGMSTKARLAGIFTQFWAVLTFVINGLIFFYVGASSVNFTIRSAQSLYMDTGGIQLVRILLYKLPLIYLASFALRFIFIFISFKLLQYVRLSGGLSLQEVIFVTVSGLRGSLSLVLAQSAATLASSHEADRRVKAEIAIYTAGYVIMTLLINAPLCGPLLTLLGLDKIRQEQLAMRGEVKNLFRKFTSTAIEDLAAGQDEDELLQGLDWAMLKLHTNFDKQLDKELPEIQPRVRWCHFGGWWRTLTVPARMWEYVVVCLRGRCSPGNIELVQGEEALSMQRKEAADLKRATNFNLREMKSHDLRSQGSVTMPSAAGASAASAPTALIIRDPPAMGTMSSMSASTVGRSLTGGSHYSAATQGSARWPPAAVTGGSLRRSTSHRFSTLVVGQPGMGAAGGGDREPSVHGRAYNRSSSRFFEGAVTGLPLAGILPFASQPPQRLSRDYSSRPVVSASPEKPRAPVVRTTTGPSDSHLPQIDVVLEPPVQDSQYEEQQQHGTGDDSADGLVDPELMALADAQESNSGGEPAGAEVTETATTEVGGSAVAAITSSLPFPNFMTNAAGGDSLIEAAVWATQAAAALADAASANVEQPIEGGETSQPLMYRQGSFTTGPSPFASTETRGLSLPSSPVRRGSTARPSPLSRGTVGNAPTSGQLSRLHVSTSLTIVDGQAPSPEASMAVGTALGSGLGQTSSGLGQTALGSGLGQTGSGVFSEPEPMASRVARTTSAADRSLLQSVLVIKPVGRGAGLPTLSTGPSTSVRLVQRLDGDGGHGSALQELRTDTMTTGGRGLGHSSVRLPVAPMKALEAAQPPAATEPELSGAVSLPSKDRPVGRSSLPTLGAAQDGRKNPGAWEPPSLSPFEFAPPEDLATVQAGWARPDGGDDRAQGHSSLRHGPADSGVGRSSMRIGASTVDGSGGLARVSVRQSTGPGGGGGGLGRASVRLGRQAGLAAMSTQLARIYDADGVSGISAADSQPAGGRSSLLPMEPPPPLASNGGLPVTASGAPSPTLTLAGARTQSLTAVVSNHIALQVQALQQRESQQQQLGGTSSGGAFAQPQHSLGTTSKSLLLSLIRRSASHGGAANGGAVGGGGTRENSGRSGAESGRRTRFADSVTVAALARASAAGGAPHHSSSEIDSGGLYRVEGAEALCNPLLVEYRLRLLTGLKQYYRQKHAAGSLSPSAYKVLSYITDQSAHYPEQPLSLWTMAKREVSSGIVMEVEVATYFKLKQWTAIAKSSNVTLVRMIVPRLLVPFVRLISSHTSAATLRGLETAVELWASLTQSLQTEWLQYSGLYGEKLLEEVEEDAGGAWSYIIERRIESPKKFGAVQTHRAVIDVLTQQQAFVKEMNEGGMIEESECRKIIEMVEKRLQLLARRGPRWRQPTVMEILMGTAVLRGVSPRVVEWIRKNSTFRVYPQGAAIWDFALKREGEAPDGLMIVIRGVVRMMLEQETGQVPYYLGAGGVGGLVSCVLETHVPGMSSVAAYAEGNALGKGPLVMHVPWSVLQVIRRFSREERVAPYQALDLQMYRTAAVYVLDLLRQQVMTQFSAFIRSALLTILDSHRLDGPAIRRQRIRLLLQPMAADHIVDGGIDWIGELLNTDPDIVYHLLDPTIPTGLSAAHHNHFSHHHHHHTQHTHSNLSHPHSHSHSHQNFHNMSGNDEASTAAESTALSPAQLQLALSRLAASAWVEVMYKAIAAATGAVLDLIRCSLKDSILVVLSHQQSIIQRSTMVLIQGSLDAVPMGDADDIGGTATSGGPFVASINEIHVAPSVMVWVSDYFEGDLAAQKELHVVAGAQGATLLMWGMCPEDVLLPSPKTAQPPPVQGKPATGAPPPPPLRGGGSGGADGEPTAKAEPSRGIFTVAKSMALRARQEGSKVKPEAAAKVQAVTNGGVSGDGRKDGGGFLSPKCAAEVNGEGQAKSALPSDAAVKVKPEDA